MLSSNFKTPSGWVVVHAELRELLACQAQKRFFFGCASDSLTEELDFYMRWEFAKAFGWQLWKSCRIGVATCVYSGIYQCEKALLLFFTCLPLIVPLTTYVHMSHSRQYTLINLCGFKNEPLYIPYGLSNGIWSSKFSMALSLDRCTILFQSKHTCISDSTWS